MVFLLSIGCLFFLDKRMETILKQYVEVEVERITTNIVHKTVQEKIVQGDYDSSFLLNKKDSDNNFSYDTTKINKMKMEITKYVQEALLKLDDGIVDDFFVSNRVKTGRFQKINNGILCDISVGSLRKSILFANIGPTIPLKLTFTGDVHSDVDIHVKEYGINNVMIEIFLILTVQEQVSMPLTSSRKSVVVKTPVSLDIIRGNVPDYYGSSYFH